MFRDTSHPVLYAVNSSVIILSMNTLQCGNSQTTSVVGSIMQNLATACR